MRGLSRPLSVIRCQYTESLRLSVRQRHRVATIPQYLLPTSAFTKISNLACRHITSDARLGTFPTDHRRASIHETPLCKLIRRRTTSWRLLKTLEYVPAYGYTVFSCSTLCYFPFSFIDPASPRLPQLLSFSSYLLSSPSGIRFLYT